MFKLYFHYEYSLNGRYVWRPIDMNLSKNKMADATRIVNIRIIDIIPILIIILIIIPILNIIPTVNTVVPIGQENKPCFGQIWPFLLQTFDKYNTGALFTILLKFEYSFIGHFNLAASCHISSVWAGDIFVILCLGFPEKILNFIWLE